MNKNVLDIAREKIKFQERLRKQAYAELEDHLKWGEPGTIRSIRIQTVAVIEGKIQTLKDLIKQAEEQ